jgi:ABC-type transport system involved in multi-copper enzyme maturation permease subunit
MTEKRQLSLLTTLITVLVFTLFFPVLNLEAASLGNIHGTIVDELGHPMEGVKVMAFSETGSLEETKYTNDEGYFRMNLAGTYTMVFEKDGYVSHEMSVKVTIAPTTNPNNDAVRALAFAGVLVPLPSGDFKGGREEMVKGADEWKIAFTERWEVEQSIIQISPTIQYEETATAILDASTDFDLKTQEFIRSVSLGEALITNWASIAFLAVGLVVCFSASYMLFLRTEIRPGD